MAGRGSSGRADPDAVDTIVAQWRDERPDLDPSPIALFGRCTASTCATSGDQPGVQRVRT